MKYELSKLNWPGDGGISGIVGSLKEHFGPIPRHFSADLLASVVVFLVALPLCMGIAIASGVPPALGILSGIIGGLVVSVIAGSPLLVSGPAAGLAVLIWELVQTHGILALGPVVLIAGIIQMIAGGLRMGQWFRAVSPSVIHGMLAGIGVSIVANQLYVMMDSKPLGNGLKNLMLFPGEIERTIEALIQLPAAQWLQPIGESTHHLALLIGVIAIVITLFWDKVAPKSLKVLPAALMAVIGASAVAYVLKLPINYVSVPSSLMDSAHFISLDGLSEVFHGSLFTAALAIAFIASAETLLSAAAVDKMHDGVRTKYDQELFAQGVGNSLCGLVGALPMTGVIARSGTNVTAGAKTRTSAFLHAVWLLMFVSLFAFGLELIPIAALAGVLVVIGIKLINPDHIRHLRNYGKSEVYIYAITLMMIVATDLLDGVLIGIGLAFAKLLYSLLHLKIELKVDQTEKRAILDLHGAATFIQLPKLASTLEKIPSDIELHVNIHDLNYIDHACLDLLETWADQHESTGGRLVLEWETLTGRYHKKHSATVLPEVSGGELKQLPLSSDSTTDMETTADIEKDSFVRSENRDRIEAESPVRLADDSARPQPVYGLRMETESHGRLENDSAKHQQASGNSREAKSHVQNDDNGSSSQQDSSRNNKGGNKQGQLALAASLLFGVVLLVHIINSEPTSDIQAHELRDSAESVTVQDTDQEMARRGSAQSTTVDTEQKKPDEQPTYETSPEVDQRESSFAAYETNDEPKPVITQKVAEQLEANNQTDRADPAPVKDQKPDERSLQGAASELDQGDSLVATSVESPTPPPAQQQEVDALLDMAAKAFADHRVTRPADNNAFYYYTRALALDPANNQAKTGLGVIAKRCSRLAKMAIAKRNYASADRYIAHGLEAEPLNSELQMLREKVKDLAMR